MFLNNLSIARRLALVLVATDSTAQLTILATARQKIVEQGSDTPEERALFQRVTEARKACRVSHDEIKRLRSAGDSAGAAREFQQNFEKISHGCIAGIEAVADHQRHEVDVVAQRKKIARSLKASAEHSDRRKSDRYRSAMSMLTFYINRAGHHLEAAQRRHLEDAKDELRALCGKPAARKKARH